MSYNLNPSDDFELNLFLADLADHITKEELKKLKLLITGRGGSGKAALERIEDPIDYFEHLRQKQLLSHDNLFLLQTFIWHLGRKDLYKKFIDYGRRVKNSLYFYAPKETPENGYKYVKFHVSGNAEASRIEDVRSQLARLLGVPQDFVVVAGVEASNSLIITFMVPEECEYVLCNLSSEDKSFLLRVSVDYFTFDGKTTVLGDVVLTEEETEEIKAVRKALENEQKLQRELDFCHGELTLLKKKIKRLQDEVNLAQNPILISFSCLQLATVLYNIQLMFTLGRERVVPALKRQASVQYLSTLLEKANALGYDRKLIDEILQVNGFLTQNGISEAYFMQINQLRLEKQFLESRLIQLDYLCQRLSFTYGVKADEKVESILSQEFLLYALMQKAMPVIPIVQSNLSIDDATSREILKELSKEMAIDDMEEIRKKVTLSQEEEHNYQENPKSLLEILYNQHRQHGGINLDIFVHQYLEKGHRQNLKQKYDEIIKNLIEKNQPPSARSTEPDSDAKPKMQTKAKMSQAKQKQRTSSPTPRRDSSENDQLSEISSRLQKLENLVEKAVKGSGGPFHTGNIYSENSEMMREAAKLYFSQKYASDKENRNVKKDNTLRSVRKN